MKSSLHITPFSIQIEAEICLTSKSTFVRRGGLNRLQALLGSRGRTFIDLRQLLAYRADEFDWQAQERELNRPLSSAQSSTAFTSTSFMSEPDTGTHSADFDSRLA